MFSVLIWIAYDTRSYLRLSRTKRLLLKDPKQNEEQRKQLSIVNNQISNLQLTYIRNLTDLQLAVYFCFPNSWPSHWIGVFGVINAITGLYQAWPKSK
jgi:hypothetical protein